MTIDRPAARYGRERLSRSTRRRVAIGLTALIVTAGVALALVAFNRLGAGDVKGELGGYKLIDNQTVSVTITVTRADPERPVVCIVRARSKDGGEVGRREILVPPSTETSVQVTTEVKTTKPPAVGDIYGCGTDVPAYLRTP
ncbi:DUF4307 domain-containing protein [Mycobacterium hackensackense]|uniref:DUF4307 domain-containing protein n=1 Tax=Mycobacterium hackensackense TaxID=228909 RepID=UPI002265CFA1|nr:DUF4307 domain-containing protein [Mycobacterium hackensackense]MCV7255563.1 DUF4307 domain-containing protein [Mycobacterium hackensackense]